MSKEKFEEWAKANTQLSLEKLGNFYVYANTTSAKLGFMARQPEIDALNEKLESREAQMETVGSIERELRNELARLQAENERLRYLKDNFVRCEPKMNGKHHWIAKGRLIGEGNTFEEAIDAAMKEEK